MTTLIYNNANLSVKERLTISNLLNLFQSRLNASWLPASQVHDKPVQLAVTANDRSRHQPYISRLRSAWRDCLI